MKTYLTAIVAFCLSNEATAQTLEASAINSAQSSSAIAAEQSEQRANLGSIVMYRGSSVWGAALGCPIRYKTRQVVELGRGKFAEWSVPAGRYILVNGTAGVEVNVAPNERRYVRCQIKPGFLTGRADLQIVDEEDFARNRQEYQQKQVTSPL